MSTCPQYTLKSQDVDKFTINTLDMYLSKSNFIFPCSAPTNGQERTMKKHMLKYIATRRFGHAPPGRLCHSTAGPPQPTAGPFCATQLHRGPALPVERLWT